MSRMVRRRRRAGAAAPAESPVATPLPGRVESDAGWEALDLLPEPLRRALKETARPVSPAAVAKGLQEMRDAGLTDAAACAHLLRRLQMLERGEISAFAAHYRARHGHTYPHVEAGVSVLRYDD